MTELMELLRTRRTYRRFDGTRPVPETALRDMAEALRLPSSAGNAQPLRYVFVRAPETVARVFPHTHWAALLPPELGTPKEGERPTLFVAVLYDGSKKSKFADTDAGLAISSLTLAAWAHGVGSCILANVDRPEILEILNVPAPMELHTVVAFGYPTHRSTIVSPSPDGGLKYYLDEAGDYFVPKRPLDELITYR